MQKIRENILKSISGIEDKELLEHISLIINEYIDYFSQIPLIPEDLEQFFSAQE